MGGLRESEREGQGEKRMGPTEPGGYNRSSELPSSPRNEADEFPVAARRRRGDPALARLLVGTGQTFRRAHDRRGTGSSSQPATTRKRKSAPGFRTDRPCNVRACQPASACRRYRQAGHTSACRLEARLAAQRAWSATRAHTSGASPNPSSSSSAARRARGRSAFGPSYKRRARRPARERRKPSQPGGPARAAGSAGAAARCASSHHTCRWWPASQPTRRSLVPRRRRRFLSCADKGRPLARPVVNEGGCLQECCQQPAARPSARRVESRRFTLACLVRLLAGRKEPAWRSRTSPNHPPCPAEQVAARSRRSWPASRRSSTHTVPLR